MELNLRSVDLNLLPVFEAAYEERSLSRAAQRLAMTQPAVSHALQRLRLVFRDELFIRHSRGVLPTAAADAIYRRLRETLDTVRTVLNEASDFDPALSPRRFFLSIPHPLGPAIALRLLDRLSRGAPQFEVEFSTRSRPIDQEKNLREGLVDIAVDWLLPEDRNLNTEALFDDELVAIARDDHPVLAGALSIKTLHDASFVVLRRRTTDIERIPQYRRWLAMNLRHALEVSELLEILFVVSQSDLFGVMLKSMVTATRDAFHVRTLEIPGWGPDTIPVRMIWHPRRTTDPAHVFLREQLQSVTQEVLQAQRVADVAENSAVG